jgi:hypothetical protein
LRGIGVRQGNAHIAFGTGSWAVVTFKDITVGSTLAQKTDVAVKPIARGQGALAHEFIGNVGDTIVYLAQDNQVRLFTDSNLSYTPTYPSISLEVANELSGVNFTGGHLACIGEYTYITSPATGLVYLYQVRQTINNDGVAVGERLWHPPFTWAVSRVEDIGGGLYGFSSTENTIFKLLDTGIWKDQVSSGEYVSYNCVAAFAYRTGDRRQGLISFDKVFTEGYIVSGSQLDVTVNYNFNGSTAKSTRSVDPYLFSDYASSLGDNSLGDVSLGDDSSVSSFPKFRSIVSQSLRNIFEFQVIYSSDTAESRWEILTYGVNFELEKDQNATFLISKLNPNK